MHVDQKFWIEKKTEKRERSTWVRNGEFVRKDSDKKLEHWFRISDQISETEELINWIKLLAFKKLGTMIDVLLKINSEYETKQTFYHSDSKEWVRIGHFTLFYQNNNKLAFLMFNKNITNWCNDIYSSMRISWLLFEGCCCCMLSLDLTWNSKNIGKNDWIQTSCTLFRD